MTASLRSRPACALLVVLLLAGCYAPAPEKFELHAPEDAPSDVDVTVTLYELPDDRRVSRWTYSVSPGKTVSVEGFEDGVDYRVELAIRNATVWRDRVGGREFVSLEVFPNGTVRDVGGGVYGTATADGTAASERRDAAAARSDPSCNDSLLRG